jgi:predicted acyl esterase
MASLVSLLALLAAAATLVAAGGAERPESARAGTAGAHMVKLVDDLGLSCQAVESADGITYTKCTGELPGFDGVGLDTDVSIPLEANGPLPTIVMLHGWSGDKTDWEAEAIAGDGAANYHWNNVWFVSRGWAVVNYTARGFEESCGVLDSDPNCPTGWTHLSDRGWEVRDAQTVLGELVDAGLADASRLASTGGSYGGGQSWLLATSLPWTSPAGASLQLAAAVPVFPFTDLLYSLVPNGRQTDSVDQGAAHSRPLGVAKESYVDALYAAGRALAQGRYNTADATDLGSALDLEYAFLSAGEPYDAKPLAQEIARAYRYKSAYYAQAYFDAVRRGAVREVPVLSVQGWTDPLFPAAETLQMLRRLQAADPAYPLTTVFADIGHSNAQNPAGQWRPITALANGFLDHYVRGASGGKPKYQAYAYITQCPGPSATQSPVTGTWDRLARGSETGLGDESKSTTSADQNPVDGPASDPIVHGGCLTEDPGVIDPGGAYWTWSAPAGGFTLMGLPVLRVDYSMTGQDATVGFKLWDVAGDGGRTLVTRGVWRLAASDPATGTISAKLFGNAWRFRPGHLIELQITQADTPYLRSDNLPSSIEWSNVRLDLPAREPGSGILEPA